MNYEAIRKNSGTMQKVNNNKAYYSPNSRLICEIWWNATKHRWEWREGTIVKTWGDTLDEIQEEIDRRFS